MPPASPPHRPDRPKARAARAGGETFFKFVLLVNLVARPFAREHEREHGIRLTEWRVLRVLSAAPRSATAGEIGDALGMDKMAVSRAVRALEARGRLRRQPSPEDRRRIALEITRAGRDLVAAIEPSGRAREAALVSVLDEEERATLDALLDRLLAQARALPEGSTDQNP
ncbi:MAG TPA: MarR family winged helix-turn-helix transcriptional regulator [Acetobacteraceae bacterium]|nr:MarR family winged helix-turn-helix transcriptional regulator [Acetobacteraceae bacterium]